MIEQGDILVTAEAAMPARAAAPPVNVVAEAAGAPDHPAVAIWAEGMARVFVPLPALACHYLPALEVP